LLASDWNHHQDAAVDELSALFAVETRPRIEVCDALELLEEKDWVLVRVFTDRSESRDDLVSEDWWRMMGGGRWTSSEDLMLLGEVKGDTGSGGDREDVGSVDRVRLSKKGGGLEMLPEGRKWGGGRRAGGGGMGSVRASEREMRSGDGGVDDDEGVGEIQRRTGRRAEGGIELRRASRRSASEGREEPMLISDVTSRSSL
jgi:hypothetical protein